MLLYNALMKSMVTGSSGHLGEALVRTLQNKNQDVVGVDIKPSPFTTAVGSITDCEFVSDRMHGVDVVYHTATLHKPHVVTHSKQDFIDTNISGTLALLEAAVSAGVSAFVFTSTTSVFGDALRPPAGEPAAWVTEQVKPIPKNIYGVTKLATEDLCQLFYRKHGLNCIVLRTSRFFPEEDDNKTQRQQYSEANAKANEFLFRRVELEDVVESHLLAGKKAAAIGFNRYIISATTPFLSTDLAELRSNAPDVLERYAPEYKNIYAQLDWKMFTGIDRVYINQAAREDLQWEPTYNFQHILKRLKDGNDARSEITRAIGVKGYHAESFDEGPYPVE